MQLSDFHFDLPESQIALRPTEKRSDSRLLCMQRSSGALSHRHFHELPELLAPEDLLVFNNTRVIPARLFGRKASGGKVEILLERVMGENRVLAMLRANHPPQQGSALLFQDADGQEVAVEVAGRQDDFYLLQFAPELDLMAFLERSGHMPLPPYIKREDELTDRERYQTVYAEKAGAVAAPTAGLHFDEALLARIQEMGVHTANVTLHVGAGTFQPVRVDNITEHRMHSEYIEVDKAVVDAVAACRQRGGRVIAVGTTTVRSLETAAQGGELQPYQGDTSIFIYPGYQFQCVDALITNFHLPESTLLMLVSAFSSREKVLAAYNVAVAQGYRFFSYGDAMFMY